MITFLTSACTSELSVGVSTNDDLNFEGTYIGDFDCNGELREANGEELTVIISRISNTDEYRINLGDDVIFIGEADDEILEIEEQTLNENAAFDVITLEGTITLLQDGTFQFEFMHEVDDEGDSNCDFIIERI